MYILSKTKGGGGWVGFVLTGQLGFPPLPKEFPKFKILLCIRLQRNDLEDLSKLILYVDLQNSAAS